MTVYYYGRELVPGDVILSFRGEPWTFVQSVREPEPGRAGKVEVSKEPRSELPHGYARQSFYDIVFPALSREAPSAPVVDILAPKYPKGTPEYERYSEELDVELQKFAAGEPPYDGDFIIRKDV